jgi:prepilin-type N-terminal cleavage/methylation domain-containing protein
VYHAVRHDAPRADEGFTLVELMVVVLIIGVLVSIAIPVFLNTRAKAELKTCFANQRTIEGMCVLYVAQTNNPIASLVGPVGATHALITTFVMRPPRCPTAPKPADYASPTLAEGIYTLDGNGTVAPCAFGGLGAHGHY